MFFSMFLLSISSADLAPPLVPHDEMCKTVCGETADVTRDDVKAGSGAKALRPTADNMRHARVAENFILLSSRESLTPSVVVILMTFRVLLAK